MIRTIAAALLLTFTPMVVKADPPPKPSAVEEARAYWAQMYAGEKIVAMGAGLAVGAFVVAATIVVAAPAAATVGATGVLATTLASSAFLMKAGALTAYSGVYVLFYEGIRESRARREGFNGGRNGDTLQPPESLRRPRETGATGAGIAR